MEHGIDYATTMTTGAVSTFDFDSLFAAHYRRLARLLYRLTGDTGRAEEVASEAFWRLYRNPPPANTNLEGWLYRTGTRIAIDGIKAARRRARYEAIASAFGITVNPQLAVEATEDQGRVRHILACLKPDQATLIVMRSEDMSYAEIAAALNLNPASVGTALSRAHETFRKEYTRRYGQR